MADDFFDQLAGGTPSDPAPNGDAVQARADPRPPTEAAPPPSPTVDPFAEHPLHDESGDRGASSSRAGRDGSRGPRARARPKPPGARGLLARITTVVAVGCVLAAVGFVLAGGHDQPTTKVRAGDRASPGADATSGSARLRVRWPGARRRGPALTARWRRGGRTTLAGRLTAAGGVPVRGAVVSLLGADAARPQLGSRPVGEVRTDAHGRFHATIALDRGSARKRLTLLYLARSQATMPAARAVATLAVRAPITASARVARLPRAGGVRLRGTTAPGARIRLLAKAPGDRRWGQLASVRARRAGTWARAVTLPAPGTYRLLARAMADSDRGFGTGQSAPLTVRVR